LAVTSTDTHITNVFKSYGGDSPSIKPVHLKCKVALKHLNRFKWNPVGIRVSATLDKTRKIQV